MVIICKGWPKLSLSQHNEGTLSHLTLFIKKLLGNFEENLQLATRKIDIFNYRKIDIFNSFLFASWSQTFRSIKQRALNLADWKMPANRKSKNS